MPVDDEVKESCQRLSGLRAGVVGFVGEFHGFRLLAQAQKATQRHTAIQTDASGQDVISMARGMVLKRGCRQNPHQADDTSCCDSVQVRVPRGAAVFLRVGRLCGHRVVVDDPHL